MKKKLFYRAKGMLILLEVFGSRIGKIDFQKYLFLWTREQDEPIYDFVPYKYGCFSFQSYRDMEKLQELGYVDETPQSWILKKKISKDLIKEEDWKSLNEIKKQYKLIKGRKLLKLIYSNYPYYAINSHVSQEILTAKEMRAVTSQKSNEKSKTLFTIGYEGHSIEAYMNLLIKQNIKILCDVRKNPLSRKYGFSKNQLKNICNNLNIEYMNIPSLGIESQLRWNLKSMKEYEELFKSYKKNTLRYEKDSLDIIINLLNKKKRVAITCFEKEPEMCHRNCVADAIYKKAEKKIKIANL